MNRPIKLRRAVGTHGTLHGLEDLQKRYDAKQTLPTLLCDSPGCGASVTFVAGHTRSGAGAATPVHVPPYIALSKGAEHQAGCRYNAPAYLQALLTSAADTDFLCALPDGRHELRLLPLQQALKRTGGGPADKDDVIQRQLHLVSRLLILHALCGSDSVLADGLTLRLGKKKVDWSHFVYSQDRYDEAWERLGASATDLPMALAGTVRSHRAAQPGALFLNCAPKYQHTGIPDRRDFYEVSIGHHDAAWLRSLRVGAEIVMFGLWRQGRTTTSTRPHPTDPRRTITSITHKLALWPSYAQQLVVVE